MDPVALHLGPLTIRWYGIFFALGFLAGYQVLQWRAKKSRIGTEEAANLTFIGIIAGVLGARLFYVVTNWSAPLNAAGDTFRSNWLEIIRIDHGGLVFYGGFIVASLALLAWCRWKKLPLGETADLFAPALPLAHAFGRIGCLLNGCCYGRVTESPVGWHYPHGTIPGDAGVIPTQLFEAVANLGIMAFLLLMEKRLPRRGQLMALYVMLYAAVRFGMEFLRGDYPANQYIWGVFTPAQGVCFLLLPLGAALWIFCSRRGDLKSRPAQKPAKARK
jgi:phosphatidylglycerol:prolipoprotein diacylglycerol transferase